MSNNASFLPEDYLAQKAERRTNIISLVLFAVVMLAVLLAFVVTNQKWSKVKDEQARINSRFQQAAEQIDEVKKLDEQKDEMIHKAELAAALVERVPRSILLAELVNRMPPRLSLTEYTMESERVRTVARPARDTDEKTGRLKPKRGKTKAEAATGPRKIEAPKYTIEIAMVGVAPTDLEVSRFLTELNGFTLVKNVILQYSEEQLIEEQVMREFKITMQLAPDADVRSLESLASDSSLGRPMTGNVSLEAASASVETSGE